MSMNESLEYLPLFDAETEADPPTVTAAIGSGVAALGTPNALGGAGAVVIYMYSEARNGWGYVGVLTGSKIAGSEQVRGMGSALVAFGDTLVVGASGDRETPGRVLVLTPPYGSWSYTTLPVMARLTYKGAAKGDQFGSSLAHCSDGTNHYIAVGAPGAAAPIGVSAPGQVMVYKGLEASATPWSSPAVGNPNPAGSDSDRFGVSVAIGQSGDGAVILAVGAPGAGEGQGMVHVGRASESGKIQFGEPLEPSFPEVEDFRTEGYGWSVALRGNVLAVGSPGDPNFDERIEATGAVWLYEDTDGTFLPAKSRLYGPVAEGGFGRSVAFPETEPGARAGFIVVGAPGAGAGNAYRFVDTGDGYGPDKQFSALPGKPGNGFGTAVAASEFQNGTWCLVGAPGVPRTGQDGGGFIYVDGEPVPSWMEQPELVTEPPVRWGGLNPDWWKKFTPQIERYLS